MTEFSDKWTPRVAAIVVTLMTASAPLSKPSTPSVPPDVDTSTVVSTK